MQKKAKFIIIFLVLFVFMATGCNFIKIKGEPKEIDAGVFKSVDGGETWQQKVAVPTISGVPASIAAVDVDEIVADPQDNKALYLMSPQGLFFTYDRAERWFQTMVDKISAPVTALAVDPRDKCTIFAAVQNKIYKSIDCSRGWSPMHLEERANTDVTTLAIDYEDSNIIYAGESNGDILYSFDGGLNWATMESFKEIAKEIKKKLNIKKILIDPNNRNIIYVATEKNTLFKTTNRGTSWQHLEENLKDFTKVSTYYDLEFVPSKTNSLIYSNSYGLLATDDGGNTWRALPLLSKPGEVKIFSVAVDPTNEDIIYYVTDKAFYKTNDGGESWTSKKLISTKAGYSLYIDPKDTKIIYLGMKNIIPKKNTGGL